MGGSLDKAESLARLGESESAEVGYEAERHDPMRVLIAQLGGVTPTSKDDLGLST